MMNYHFANGNVQMGPFPMHELIGRGLKRDSLVWREGMADWQRADTVPELATLFNGTYQAPPGAYRQEHAPHAAPPPPPQHQYGQPYSPGQYNQQVANSKKLAAGILALFLGEFGVHKFVLGMTGPGLVLLLITICTCGTALPVTWLIGVIEGIIYLTKTDEEFYQTYMVEQKGWF